MSTFNRVVSAWLLHYTCLEQAISHYSVVILVALKTLGHVVLIMENLAVFKLIVMKNTLLN